MNHLRLRLNIYADEHLGTTFVIADVFPLDPSATQNLRQKLRNLEIPAGDDYDQWKEIEVPLGRYEVQVVLPSGEFLSHAVKIGPNTPDPLDVSLKATTPHEWLAFQHFQGNVGTIDRHRTSRDWVVQSIERGASDSPRFEAVRLSRRHEVVESLPPSLDAKVFWCIDRMNPDKAGQTWDLVHKIICKRSSPKHTAQRFWRDLPADGKMKPLLAVQGDDDARIYRFQTKGPVSRSNPESDGLNTWNDVPPRRRYVLIHNNETTRLVCAPVPWFDLDCHDRELAFEVMSPLGSPGVTTAIRDAKLTSIIGYLTISSLRSARILIDRAKGMLFEKFTNPLGAAAGAYVMLLTENERKESDWHMWIENLYRRFPWIPDGAISYATMKLNHQETDEDVDEALKALLTACQRGIPFYSIGMRWLLDGLTAFSEDDHYEHRRNEILSNLRHVRVVAHRTNYQQPFTSIQLSSRYR